MILTLDVGNSLIVGGVFAGETLRFQFRMTTQGKPTSDELGVFLRSVLRENGTAHEEIAAIAMCSVVPELLHSLRNACRKYFEHEPFVLQPGVRTGLKIKYRDPREVGADRIAAAIAASHRFPDRDLVVVDFGTATTVEVISSDREYLGGAILPGLRLGMEALEAGTARLPTVEIVEPALAAGRSTVESIQSGLYYGTLGAIRLLVDRVSAEVFGGERPLLIATGGFSSLYRNEKDFDHVIPDLILHGLRLARAMNS
ncbi:MAG: type III pantothenate kinase [Acidobacteriota bacterium]|nr:type III pantothenate kinase [Acidobacteriota bacterium]MDH3525772.1 type III pantothenate kinase [Acidobacteriota bacterium]